MIKMAYYALGTKMVTMTTIVRADNPNSDSDAETIFNSDVFTLPRFAMKVFAVGFLFFAIFKSISSLANSQWGQVVGYLLAASVAIFIAWNPGMLMKLFEIIGEVFKGFINMFDNTQG